MSAPIDRSVLRPAVIAASAKGCLLVQGGALISIRRAWADAEHLAEVRRAVATARASHPGKLVMLNAYRLAPEFPLDVTTLAQLRELADTMHELDRAIAAYSLLPEFGGIRAAALRATSTAVRALARPRASVRAFERLTDAVQWLVPHAQQVGAIDDPAAYVRLYRTADHLLSEIIEATPARVAAEDVPAGTPGGVTPGRRSAAGS